MKCHFAVQFLPKCVSSAPVNSFIHIGSFQNIREAEYIWAWLRYKCHIKGLRESSLSPWFFSLHLLQMCSLARISQTRRGHRCPTFCLLLFLEVQGHLAKGQRMLAGDGMSQVTKNLLDLTQRRNFYAGDLLSSVEILRNVTETFKRASYEPSSDDVQVSRQWIYLNM